MADPRPAEAPELLNLLRSGDAPQELRAFAARNLLPLDSDGQLHALLAVLEDSEPAIAETARATFSAVPPDSLSAFLERAEPTGIEVDSIARFSEDGQVLERVIRNRNVDDQTLLRLAKTVSGTAQDALVVNQVRLLRLPALIDELFENPELSAESRRRLNETREEFFDKEERRREAEQQRLHEEALLESAAQAAKEAAAVAEVAGESEEEASAEVADQLTTGALFRRIGVMTVQEKINLAYSGGKEERRILVGDANTLVGQAVLKSRGLTVNEIESFCSMRHLDGEIFRKIAMNREWMRKQAIIQAFVRNPAVPIALSLPLVKMLPIRDLKHVMRDPNLPEGLRLTARKLLEEKRH